MKKNQSYLNRTWKLALLGLGVVFIFVLRVGTVEFSRRDASEGTLLIDFGYGHQRMFSGEVGEKTTVLLALYSSSQQGAFEVRYFTDERGRTKIQSIGSAVNHSGKDWKFYLNKKEIKEVDLNRTLLTKGDFIEARFE